MNQQETHNATNQFDEQRLSALKKSISLSKSQLLELAYDDEKFLHKLQSLNKLGYDAITEENYNEAIIYLSEAENILEYAASCGKTIERNLIITTLQNEACVYHRVWQLQKSINYIEAIIYNITSFLETEKGIDLKLPTLQENSDEYIRTSIYLKNKLHLVFYYLQFCAVSSQNQLHENALSAASKALNLMKEICEEEYNLQRIARKNGLFSTIDDEHNQFLLELHNIKEFRQENNSEPLQKSIEKFLVKAKKTHMKFKLKIAESKHRNSKIQKELENYSIGYVMQITPIKLPKQPQLLNIKEELQYINKIYKAIYISICHFTMATELRLLSSEKFPIDHQLKKSSFQFKTSQIHHLIAIITAGLYIPCQTVYFQHILNSFKNHYGIDLAQKDSQISLTSQTWNEQDDDLIHLQTSSLNLKKDHNNSIDSQDFLSSNKLKNSIKNTQQNISLASPQLYGKIKKNMFKNKIPSGKQSQKSLRTSAHDTNFNTPLTFNIQSKSKSKSKSKNKSVKKSNLKESSKSRKKSRKNQDKVKSPSVHKKIQAQIKKKQSDVKEKKNFDVKNGNSRSKTKSGKKPNRSRNDLEDSKQKVTNTKNYSNTIQSIGSGKKLIQVSSAQKTEKQRNERQQHMIGKTISNNVYIQRSNNLYPMAQKDKKVLKKEMSSINSNGQINGTNSDNLAFKFIPPLKKNKSPTSYSTASGTVTEKQSRSLKKITK